MNKIFLTALLFSVLNAFSQNATEKIKIFEKDLDHWNSFQKRKWTLKERMAFHEVNAVSIAVINNYKVEWMKAYGYADVSERRLATTRTLFQAGSVSKSINSLGILKLVQEGRLSLDSDINHYLTGWKFPYDSVARGKMISLSNLLSHMAGLSVGGYMGYEKGEVLPTTVQILKGEKPSNSDPVRSFAQPGSTYRYSGGGIMVTQLVLENTTREKYEQYMQRNVLIPLGMTRSSFDPSPAEEKQRNLATGYNTGTREIKGKYHLYPEKAAAGLWTSPADLAKYLIENQLSLLGKSNKILNREMSEKRIKDNHGVMSSNFDGAKYFGHGGGTEGFVCQYIGSAEGGNGVVVMTNGRSTKLLDEIINSIAALNGWKNYPLEPQRESIGLTIRKECYRDIDKGLALYQKLKKENPEDYDFSDQNELNNLGYEFLQEGHLESAIRIFSLNISEFPDVANGFDSRGEAYFKQKEYAQSERDYMRVLQLDPVNQNAKEMLIKIQKTARE